MPQQVPEAFYIIFTPPPREQLCNRSCSNKTHTTRSCSKVAPGSCWFLLKEQEMRQGNGLRVARIPKDVYSQMSAKQRIDIINEALRARIFIILGGAFDQQKVERKNLKSKFSKVSALVHLLCKITVRLTFFWRIFLGPRRTWRIGFPAKNE